MRIAGLLLIIIFPPLLGGCGCANVATGAPSQSWIEAQGGLLHDANQQARVDSIAAHLSTGCDALHTRVRILDSDTATAFGWPDGTLFITRGLVNRADDDIVAAALAHEIGHLLDAGGAGSPASVRGEYQRPDVEARADALGFDLLREQHINPSAMPRMLELVIRSNALSKQSVQRVQLRISALRRRESE